MRLNVSLKNNQKSWGDFENETSTISSTYSQSEQDKTNQKHLKLWQSCHFFESSQSFQDAAVAGWEPESFNHVPWPWIVNNKEQVGDATRARGLYRLLDDGA